ncbi:protein of unknown function [Methylocaldum szegediense]|uniref:Uncharacterized protein n=1 Tax=Methylocaldum szegediense TaxID=73780 RepID=A0ABM9I826_9GAMM|nr:protein of unknown function [Methylocaldum szegediense]
MTAPRFVLFIAVGSKIRIKWQESYLNGIRQVFFEVPYVDYNFRVTFYGRLANVLRRFVPIPSASFR